MIELLFYENLVFICIELYKLVLFFDPNINSLNFYNLFDTDLCFKEEELILSNLFALLNNLDYLLYEYLLSSVYVLILENS